MHEHLKTCKTPHRKHMRTCNNIYDKCRKSIGEISVLSLCINFAHIPKKFLLGHLCFMFWTPNTSILGANLEPSWPSVWFLDGPRGLPDLPKRPSRSNLEPSWLSNLPQDGPGAFQHPSKRPPRAPRKSCFVVF